MDSNTFYRQKLWSDLNPQKINGKQFVSSFSNWNQDKKTTNHPFKHCVVTTASRPTNRCGVLLFPWSVLVAILVSTCYNIGIRNWIRERFSAHLDNYPICHCKRKLNTSTPWSIHESWITITTLVLRWQTPEWLLKTWKKFHYENIVHSEAKEWQK